MPVRYRKLFWLGTLFIVVTSTALAVVTVRSKTGRKSVTESMDADSLAAPISSAGSVETSTVSTAASGPTQQPNNARLEAELITLRPTGFEPSEITRPSGPFILALHNRSGLEQLLLRINRSSGTRIREVQMRWDRSDWSGVVELPVGNYTVTEVNNPDWIFRLTIAAQ